MAQLRAASGDSAVGKNAPQSAMADDGALKNLNIVIVTHGLTLRLLLMRYFQLRVTQFESSLNPSNASLVVMERHHDDITGEQWYELDAASQAALNIHNATTEQPFWLREDGLELASELHIPSLGRSCSFDAETPLQ
jgi:hypothetical protein